MTAGSKSIGIVLMVALAGIACFAWPDFFEQRIQNAAAKPLFEAAVTRQLKVGDSLAHVQDVLTYAGLGYEVVRGPFPRPVVQSIYRAGRLSGFQIQLELDNDDRVSKIDIHEYFTGP